MLTAVRRLADAIEPAVLRVVAGPAPRPGDADGADNADQADGRLDDRTDSADQGDGHRPRGDADDRTDGVRRADGQGEVEGVDRLRVALVARSQAQAPWTREPSAPHRHAVDIRLAGVLADLWLARYEARQDASADELARIVALYRELHPVDAALVPDGLLPLFDADAPLPSDWGGPEVVQMAVWAMHLFDVAEAPRRPAPPPPSTRGAPSS